MGEGRGKKAESQEIGREIEMEGRRLNSRREEEDANGQNHLKKK